ncbi:unnamed protein product [Didymodactylos carnosus]|uniref:Uncharacterized protein n=1 Tax=Didymodactylos carnosus TaxID=1234261 RepID=A0A814ARL2_9BILA|nr:unnamed protein product [Didymodactylos carnosus]CAF0964169.1 unnamed protein product [Didymodactylos carnosus]CAF3696347.1 unnamed protein product [Didymodactylos carnosus]CAF3736192.1 unnamed protein product [Didymodactylos carnosus]
MTSVMPVNVPSSSTTDGAAHKEIENALLFCGCYTHCFGEFQMYQNNIIEMTTQFDDGCFYDYHRAFATKCAALLKAGIVVDWSTRVLELYSTIVAGRKAKTCSVCGSVEHASTSCPNFDISTSVTVARERSTVQPSSTRPLRPHAFIDGADKEIRELWNVNRCHRSRCSYHHVCNKCFAKHRQGGRNGENCSRVVRNK